MNKYLLVSGIVFVVGLAGIFVLRGGFLEEVNNTEPVVQDSQVKEEVSEEVSEEVVTEPVTVVETVVKQESPVVVQKNTVETKDFTISSTAFTEGDTYPTKYTCDGERATPPLAWTGVPTGTESLVIIMDHSPRPGDYKWYWTVYNIPGDADGINENEKLGQEGTNEISGLGYGAPCSKGPGVKDYAVHVYALSRTLNIRASNANRESLLSAMAGSVLAEDEINVIIER